MVKKEHYQAAGITLVTLLVIASIAYVAVLPQPNPITSTSYPVKNFDSYRSFTTFLQGSNSNTYYSNYQAAPSQWRNQGVMVEDMSVFNLKSSEGGQTIDYSKTNVQVQGVDEPDIVKTDGTYLYIVSDNKVLIVYAFPSENAAIVATITVAENLTIQNIFINGTRLVIFAQNYVNYPILYDSDAALVKDTYTSSFTPWYSSPDTYIQIYDLTEITTPRTVKEIIVGGYFSNARLIGQYIYVITTQYTYNTYNIEEGASIVPRLSLNGEPLEVALPDIYYVDSPQKSSTITNIVSVNIHNDDEQIHAKIFLIGDSQTLYMSQNTIYLTSTTWTYYDYTQLQTLVDGIIMPLLPDSIITQLENVKTLNVEDYQKQQITFWILQNYAQTSMPESQKKQLTRDLIRQTEQTIIHRISVNEGDITYIAQDSVPGYINNQFSLDENNGYLRVSTTLQGGSISYLFGSIEPETNLYILDLQMKQVGSLEDITPNTGESIYATRFVGDTCYMVTFKQTDPFLVIDLSNPTNPTLLGELKIPGYSTYLHPYDDTHVIGIGRNSSSVKIALYDITDINNPTELGLYSIENTDQTSYWWTESAALYEHKAFLFDKEKQLLVIPAGNYSQQSAYVFDISLDSGISLKGTVTHHFTRANQEQNTYYYWVSSGNSIQRSLFIDNTLYTISTNGIHMNDLGTLAELNSLQLLE